MKVTNPDRLVFPDDGITKGQVAGYYAEVADDLLPFIAHRALTVQRYPRGIGDEGFMQKNTPDHYPPFIGRHTVPKEDGGTTTYPVVTTTEGIAFFANLGVITFHVPPVTIDDEHHPDWLVWDLDPPEGEVALVRRAAWLLRELLADFGIEALLMTSGSKGYHLRLPIVRSIDTDTAALIARGAAALGAHRHADTMTVEFKKADRGDRVFVDWLRNAPRATSVAPYALRPRRGAPVAMPIAWDDLDAVAPDAVTPATICARLESHPWGDAEPVDVAGIAARVREALDAAGLDLQPFDRFRS